MKVRFKQSSISLGAAWLRPRGAGPGKTARLGPPPREWADLLLEYTDDLGNLTEVGGNPI